jgi:lipopolysaccharide transport system permease protein
LALAAAKSGRIQMNPYTNMSAAPQELIASFWRNRDLIVQMTKREVLGRYKGSVMGLTWSFFNPVLMLLVYTFFFSVVFKARWGANSGDESKASFAIILFVGMIIHGLFSEVINRAPSLILSNVNYVKKVLFPLETLPWISIGSALFHALIGLGVLLVAQIVINQHLPWTAIFFPLILLPLILASLGFAWFLAALGVYARDVGQITGVFTSILLFLTPVFYPLSALPPAYQTFLKLNPLTFIIEEGRNSLVFGVSPDWAGWCIAMASSCVIAWMGFWWFQKTRKGFADVL